jgi:hypothetical protein
VEATAQGYRRGVSNDLNRRPQENRSRGKRKRWAKVKKNKGA